MNNTKRKILFILPSLSGGGAERTLINLLNEIDYNRFEIDLILVLKQGVLLEQMPKEVNLLFLFKNNFFVRTLAYLQKKTGITYPYKYMLKRIIYKNYDVGISFLDSNFTDLLFLMDNITKRYTWVHSSYVTNPNFSKSYKSKKYRTKLINNRYKKLDGIYFVSENAKDEFIEIFGKFSNMDVIYNLIGNEQVKRKAREELFFPKSNFRFVALGSLYKVKGYDKLIYASKIVKDAGYDFIVLIAGKGPEDQSLKRLVKENGLDGVVQFTGFLKNPYPLLNSCDVFIMTSVSEGLPTVLCEAMILGKPTLVTNCSGCKELVDYGKYGLMSVQTPEDISRNMIEYLSNNKVKEYFAEKSSERAEIFNKENVLNEYYTIFNS